MKTHRIALPWLLLGGLACGAPQRSNVGPNAGGVARPVAAPPPVPWEAMVLPDIALNEMRADVVEPDGTIYLHLAGLRARVGSERVDWATEFTQNAIVAQVRDGERWYFATNDGAVYRSQEGFLGGLTRVGDTQGQRFPAGRYFVSHGTLALRSADNTLWFGGPQDQLHHAAAPIDGPLVDAGWVDNQWGLVAIAPGRLFQTTDGGRTFGPVDLQGRTLRVIYPHGDFFALATTEGHFRMERSGGLTPYTGALREPAVPALSSEVQARVRDSLVAQYALTVPALGVNNGIMMPNGRAMVRRDQSGGEAEIVTVQPGSEMRRFDAPGSDCELHLWNGLTAALCRDGEEWVLHTSDGARDFAVVWRQRRGNRPEAVFSPDTAAWAFLGSCETEESNSGGGRRRRAYQEDNEHVCYTDGSTFRTLELGAEAELKAVRGDLLLARRTDADSDDEAERAWFVLRASTGERTDVVLDLPDARVQSASLTTDGLVAGTALRHRTRYSFIGSAEAPLTPRVLPRSPAGVATSAAFADAQHGLAAGGYGDLVWVTSDGGQHWQRPSFGTYSGEAGAVRVAWGSSHYRNEQATRPDGEPTVWCNPLVCSAGAKVVWLSPAAYAGVAQPVRVWGAPSTVNERVEPAAHSSALRQQMPELSCRVPDRPAGPPAPAMPATGMSGRAWGLNGWVEPHAPSVGTTMEGAYAFAWGGTDDRGRFTARARAGTLPALQPPTPPGGTAPGAPTDGTASVLPRYLSRALAVVERCSGVDASTYCDVLVLRPGQAPQVYNPWQWLAPFADHERIDVRGALAMPDGGVLLHLRPVGDGSSASSIAPGRTDVVVRLDARGQVAAHRGFAWGGVDRARMLALRDRVPGLAVTGLEGTRQSLRFYTLEPTDEGTTVELAASGRVRPCGGREAPQGALTLVSEWAGWGPRFNGGGSYLFYAGEEGRAHLEVQGGQVCLREYSLAPVAGRSSRLEGLLRTSLGMYRVVGRDGALQASVHGPQRDTTVSCNF